MKKIRVLHVVPSLAGGGAERQVADLLTSMQETSIEAAALSVYDANGQGADTAFQVLLGGRKRRSDLVFLHRLVGAMRAFRPDIIHAHTHAGKYWGRAAAVLAGVRTIVYTEHSPCDPRRGVLERLIDPLLLQCTSRVITFFPEQRAVLARRDGIPLEKIVTIPNGLPCETEAGADERAVKSAYARQVLGVRPETFAVLVAGRLQYPKNQQLVLHAVASLDAEAQRSLHVYFAGGGADDEDLRTLSQDLCIAERVSFLGHRSDVRDLMRASDLVVMPSLSEGMPLVLIEAMLARVPIVSTPWVGVRDMLGDGRYGFIAAGWEPEVLGQEIKRALSSPAARSALTDRAARYVRERFSIGKMADAHEELYANLAAAAA